MAAIGSRINRYMIERLGVKSEEVSKRRDDFLKTHGTTLNALRRYYFVDPDEFLDFVHDIPLRQYLQYDPALDRMMGSIKLGKIIFTNADAKHARRVLACLGILRHFEWIIDIHLLDFINKPDRRAYLKAMDIVAALPEESLLVEDSWANVIPARRLGMTTVLIGEGSRMDGAHYRIDRITDLENLLDQLS
jgi:putative hydrolase of the HAD superfamily